MPVLKEHRPTAARADASAAYVTIPLERIRPGSRLRAPLWEDRPDREVLLLAAGTLLAPGTLEQLKLRGITQVKINRSEIARLVGSTPAPVVRTAPAAPVDEVRRQPGSRYGVSSDSLIHKVAKHGATHYDAGQLRQFASDYADSVGIIRSLFDGMASGSLSDAPQLAAVSSESLVKITTDLDLFVALGVRSSADNSPGRHSMQTAMVAMSVGTVLGLKRDDLIELGIGCLIHDSGMLRLRADLVNSPRNLSQVEFLEVTKHPAITYDLLRSVPDVPTGARMVAYQMHERCNGTGYPRRRHANQIHPLAKIAAVADVFVALVSPRPWREALLPYRAMEKIIRETHQGLFDPEVVRALLQTVSLFPIGSFVQTNDGRVGTVVRTNREHFTRPFVELWTPGNSKGIEIVDLASVNDLQITRPLSVVERPRSIAESFSEDFWE